ncbi:MAG: hypothetical protein GX369_03765 [Euryarchaeota archaeon]|nr:hypothetical protein [Euryarchaeota archaeon]
MEPIREEILNDVKKTVMDVTGVEAIRFLDPELREEIIRIEHLAEKNGACGGLMPFRNNGVWEALSREINLIIIGNAHFIIDNEDLLTMLDTSGQVLGEYVPPHLKEEFIKNNPRASFLSDDFVLYPDVEINGEPYFLIDEIAFPPLEKVVGITRITSGSVSTMTDDWIRAKVGCEGPGRWTHLVGFDITP